jgi:aspartate racemase
VIGRLARAGATVVGIPCHTAHSPRIREEIEAGMEQGSWGVKLLSLVHLAAAYVARTTASGGKVGILATTGTVMSGVYDAPCREQGLRPVYPSGDVQVRLVHPAIYDPLYGIKARSHPVTDQATKLVEGAVDHLIERGVDCVLLACTELPLAYPQAFRETTRIVDATRVLARALVREVAPLQLRDDLG